MLEANNWFLVVLVMRQLDFGFLAESLVLDGYVFLPDACVFMELAMVIVRQAVSSANGFVVGRTVLNTLARR